MTCNEHTQPVTQKSLAIEDFVSHMFEDQAKQDEEKIKKFNSEAGWVAAEVEHWKQRCEELEIELEVMRNAFPEHDNDILPKPRGLF